ncbi:hypothetical protein HXX76_014361 [Chlamydomonas incerta]|uniref:DNA repair metallo-beta-lactamase domain-containing protein n=1 Tax=Chlamydomonas incerta TaxID=51695 RepID=A0A835SFL8_CHLIN|nr:hypothetical protein HXX76_014361 [Chlamydomonas incerta]|eukprot:KAG2424636.1 hypothetical protein HXX76_014361 [Chlamydomonas incerta]
MARYARSTDHTDGIETTTADVYCTDLTRRLLLLRCPGAQQAGPQNAGQGNRFHTLELGARTKVSYDGTTFDVTALDANHCPGSAMFLFQGAFGNILHTGDCRFTEVVVRSVQEALGRGHQHGWGGEGGGAVGAAGASGATAAAAAAAEELEGTGGDVEGAAGGGGGERLDLVYLDCTFADLPLDFPTREDAVRQAEQLIRRVGPGARVYLAADMLGQEPLLALAGSAFNKPVYVPPPERHREYGFDNADLLRERRGALAALQQHPDLAPHLTLSDDPACTFHMCGVRNFAQRGGARASRTGSGSLRRTGSGSGAGGGAAVGAAPTAPSAELSNSLGEGAAGAVLPDPDGGEGEEGSGPAAAAALKGDEATGAAAGGSGRCLYIRASTQVFAQQVRAQYSSQGQMLSARAASPPPTAAIQERSVHYVLFSQHSSRGELVAALDALRPRAVLPINQDQIGSMAALVAERAGPEPPQRVAAEIEARLAWRVDAAAAGAAGAAAAAGVGRSAGRAAADPDSWDWDEEEGGEHEAQGHQSGLLEEQPQHQLEDRQDARQGQQRTLPTPAPHDRAAPRVDAVATVTLGGGGTGAGAQGSLPKDGSEPPLMRPLLPPAAHAAPAQPDGGGLRDVSSLERRCLLLQRLGFPLRMDGSCDSGGTGSGAPGGSSGGAGGGGGASAFALAYAQALRAAIISATAEAAAARRRQQQEEMGWQAGGGGTWCRCATLTCMCAAATARLRAQGRRCCCGDVAALPAPQVSAAAGETGRSPPPRVATLSGLQRMRGATAMGAQTAAAAAGTAGEGETGALADTRGDGAGTGPGAHSRCPRPPLELQTAPQQALRSPLRPIQPLGPIAGVAEQKQPQQQGHMQQQGDKPASLVASKTAHQPGGAAAGAAEATGTPARSRRTPLGDTVPRATCLLSLILGSPGSASQPSPLYPQHRHGNQLGATGRAGVAPNPQRPCDHTAGVTPPAPPHATPRDRMEMAACSGGSRGSGSGGTIGGQRAGDRRRLSGFVGLFTTPDSPESASECQRFRRLSPARPPLDLPSPGVCQSLQQPALVRVEACGWELGGKGPGAVEMRDAAGAADQEQVPPCTKPGWAAAAGVSAALASPMGAGHREPFSGIPNGKRPRLLPTSATGMGVVAGATANATSSCYLAALLASSSDEGE